MNPLKNFLLRATPLTASIVLSLFCLLVAWLITYIGVTLAGSPNLVLGMSIATICGLLLAPPLTYAYLALIKKLAHANQKLSRALGEVKELSGLLPICASCKSIRDDAGYWQGVEAYIQDHSHAQFTHSICPKCQEALKEELRSLKPPSTAEKK